jgi:nitrogen regulatory protein PII
MNLTKEYLDKALKNLATKSDLKNIATKDDLKKFVTKDDLDERFEKQTRILMAYSDDQVSKLAAMVADGFEEIKDMLDVRERMTVLEKDMQKIKEALNV